MPDTRWIKGKLCGSLDLEEGKNKFHSKYFVLDKEKDQLKIYFDHPDNLPKLSNGPYETIDLNFISKVSDARKIRPKAGFCFAITIAGDQTFLQAESEDEMSIWIDSLNEACKITVPKSTTQTFVPPNSRNIIAGGVIVNSANESESSEFVPPALSLPCIMSGYATKQGAVRKNWKKRYFVLDEKGLSYFKSNMERDPIKTIEKDYIIRARAVEREHHPHREYLFELITEDRTFNIQCDKEKECKQWISKINESIGHPKDKPFNTYSEEILITICNFINMTVRRILHICNSISMTVSRCEVTPEGLYNVRTFLDRFQYKPYKQNPPVSTSTINVENVARPPPQEEIEPNSKAVWKQEEPIAGDRRSKREIRGNKKSWTLWSN